MSGLWGGVRQSSIESTASSCYELDLPSLPHTGMFSLNPSSSVYTNTGAQREEGEEEEEEEGEEEEGTKQLYTIREMDHCISPTNSEDDEEREHVTAFLKSGASVVPASPLAVAEEGDETSDNKYLMSLVGTEEPTNATYQEKVAPINLSSPASATPNTAAATVVDETTGYTVVKSKQTASPLPQPLPPPPPPEEKQKKRKKSSWLSRTLQRQRMMAIFSKKEVTTSRRGAKKFFFLLTTVFLLAVIILMGVCIGTVTWFMLKKVDNRLQSHTSSIGNCRVGRNWMSLAIDERSPCLSYNFTRPGNQNRRLDALTGGLSTKPNQILLYSVIETRNQTVFDADAAMLDVDSSSEEESSMSFINIVMWTRNEIEGNSSFRQNMAVLNGNGGAGVEKAALQIVSGSFWFPLEATDELFHVKVDLLGSRRPESATSSSSSSSSEEEMAVRIKMKVYLSGYC